MKNIVTGMACFCFTVLGSAASAQPAQGVTTGAAPSTPSSRAESSDKADLKREEPSPEDKSIPRKALSMLSFRSKQSGCRVNSPLIGGYTRVFVEYTPPVDVNSVRVYDKETRSWFNRFFMGKSITRLLAVKANLTRPEVSVNTIFASISHSSNKKEGEAWSTDFNVQRQLTPFFRIDPDSVINLELAFKLSASYDASVAADTLDLLKRATQLIAPQTSLVTSLNQERFDKTSQFVDSAVSSLLKEAIVERTTNDYRASEWAHCDLGTVTLYSPMHNDITPNTGNRHNDPHELGSWTLKSSPVLLSVFTGALWPDDAEDIRFDLQAKAAEFDGLCQTKSAGSICDSFKNLDPQRVMGFRVDANVTVAQALAADTGLAAAKDALMQANDAGKRSAAIRVCSLAADKAQALGFNRYDSAAIVWAYVRQVFASTPDATTALRTQDYCTPLNAAKIIGLI